MKSVSLVLLGFTLAPVPAVAASFDCAKAARPDEIAVCANPRLSALDDLLGKAYAKAQKTAEADDKANILADGRNFLARRGRCKSDIPCLTAAYAGILEDLQTDGSGVDVPDSVTALDMVAAVPPEGSAVPVHEGECVQTRIKDIGGRLEGDTTFDSGATVEMTNGGVQVTYEKNAAIVASRPGDAVLMCLTSIPKHCPPGDDRGRMYTTTNLRTKGTWSLSDSEHMCGGA